MSYSDQFRPVIKSYPAAYVGDLPKSRESFYQAIAETGERMGHNVYRRKNNRIRSVRKKRLHLARWTKFRQSLNLTRKPMNKLEREAQNKRVWAKFDSATHSAEIDSKMMLGDVEMRMTR